MNLTAIRRAVYGKLAGDTTLNALLASPASGYAKAIYFQQAPQGAPFPFLVFSKQSGNPTGTMTSPQAYETDTWLVKAVDRATTADPAEAIAGRVDSLLSDANLSISGATTLFLRRQSDVQYPETTDGVLFQHVGSLFRLVTA